MGRHQTGPAIRTGTSGVVRARPCPRRTRDRPDPSPGKTRAGPRSAKGESWPNGPCQGPGSGATRAWHVPGPRQARAGPAWPEKQCPMAIITIEWGYLQFFFANTPLNPNGYYSHWGIFAIFLCKYPLTGICLQIFFCRCPPNM